MLGEGFDLPNLKIAAVHDTHKSLAVLLQFTGRFTRAAGKNVGEASVIANVADQDVSDALDNYKPGDTIKIKTRYHEEILEYDIELSENTSPEKQGKAMIGITYSPNVKTLADMMTDMFIAYKETGTDYQPRFNSDFMEFIYYLIWWLALMNIGVALMNMWPVAIFDGGRMFMLTVWGITKSEKFAMVMFKFTTYLILGALLLLMLGWVVAIF